MKKLLTFLFLLCVSNGVAAIQHFPQIILYISKDSLTLPLDYTENLHQHIEIYADTTKKMDWATIQSQIFVPLAQMLVPSGIMEDSGTYTYWTRFSLKNTHPTDTLMLLFEVGYRSVTHFVSHNKVENAGFIPTKGGLCRLVLPPQSTTMVCSRFFHKRSNHTLWDMRLMTDAKRDWNLKYIIQENLYNILFNAFFLGALFLMMSISVINYYLQKQLAYLYYAAYLLFLLLSFLKNMESVFRHAIRLIYGWFPITLDWSEGTLAALVQLSYLLFLVTILNLKTVKPICYTFINICVGTTLAFIPMEFLVEYFFYQANYSLLVYGGYRIISSVAGLYVLWLIRDVEGRAAQLLFWGIGFLLVGLVASLYLSSNIPLYGLGHLVFLQLGVIAEIIFFGSALAYKSYEIDLERQEKIKENNRLLTQLSNQATLKFRAIEAELKALKGQMRSHLIFNVLNSFKFKFLQLKDAKTAEQMSEFSTFLRLMLAHSRESVVTLAEELVFLQKYIEIEQKYAQNGFTLQWQIQVEHATLQGIRIPSLLLQPFVENAILHGLRDKKEGNATLRIQIKRQENGLLCVIEDNGKGRLPKKEPQNAYGIQIVEDRIASFIALHKTAISLRIHDLVEAGQPSGTSVRVAFGLGF